MFLQAAVALIGAGALGFMLWEPRVEGGNVNATLFEIYFKDPFLAYAYIGSIPFFAALVQAFKVLGYAGRNEVFSPAAVKALGTIKYYGLALIGLVAIGEVFIMLGDSDDRAGGVFMGLLITFGSILIAAGAAFFERLLRKAAAMKSAGDKGRWGR
jgi:hypothetical protein